ncbi:molybdopterin converting factor subunit 1 [Aquibacillus salsiterrae]|uniref:Molybdopterin synthase sulfur carrier subunit n=1 Tax=Aquibacillus salsiterrae TaxID=2950439 RepID=A0A9X3WF46_9BACI|nr:molybdopterin converting factor subunit 1 [Aquibacillus salsiterrae]MDC3417853.1 molybdopterin converting factor subunit 1 [Aquibacillus salsiterrae]
MITVLLFAHLQEEAKTSQIELEVDRITVDALKKDLAQRFHLSQLEHAMVAINEEFALNEDTIQSGDAVAIIPPVSGG